MIFHGFKSSGRAIVLHPTFSTLRSDQHSVECCLSEAVDLAEAINLTIIKSRVINSKKPEPSILLGKGIARKFKEIISSNNIDLVIVDWPLSPVQQRNLETLWNCKVLDRTGLIIEIFGSRAKTKEGVLQVELAALTYQRGRLVRSWTHLERQRGGAGFMGGPGETQIEADRRLISGRINKIKKDLKAVRRTRTLHRVARDKVPFPTAALIGYTNSGKSTLFNALTGSNVLSKNQLFATLDPTMRHVKLPSGQNIILSDTVGFISALPHELVEAFNATLEELTEADILIHICDVSHPDSDNQKKEVLDILHRMGIHNEKTKPIIEVYNKIDQIDREAITFNLNKGLRSGFPIVFTSALKGEGLHSLLESMELVLDTRKHCFDLKIPWKEGKTLSWLYRKGDVINRIDGNNYVEVTVRLAPEDALKIKNYKQLV